MFDQVDLLLSFLVPEINGDDEERNVNFSMDEHLSPKILPC